MSKKLDQQLSSAVLILKMDMRDVQKRVAGLEADMFALIVGMGVAAGIMIGYIVANLVGK